MERLVASPACLPNMELEEVLRHYARLGFKKMEVFTYWAEAAFDYEEPPDRYLNLSERYDIDFTSLHLPPLGPESHSLEEVLRAARFCQEIGAEIAIFKAESKKEYLRSGPKFLDAIEELGIDIQPVVENHSGTPISSLQDYREVLEGIDDLRMGAVLEVGHFHKVGIEWEDGYELLKDRIALVHLKDMQGSISVPYGRGEIDFPKLFDLLEDGGYQGDYVVELEFERGMSEEEALEGLEKSLHYLNRFDL